MKLILDTKIYKILWNSYYILKYKLYSEGGRDVSKKGGEASERGEKRARKSVYPKYNTYHSWSETHYN